MFHIRLVQPVIRTHNMKFYLKITAFLALILISKFTRGTEDVALASDEGKQAPAALTTYNQQGSAPERIGIVEHQKVRAIYK